MSIWATVPTSMVVVILLAAAIWALVRRPMWGFLGGWFFLILAPTSSVMPIRDLAFEQRMYLPLAAVIALAVLAARALWKRLAPQYAAERWYIRTAAAIALMAPLTIALGWRTYVRNLDYEDPILIWSSAVKVSPQNPRAWSNLGFICDTAGRYAEAKVYSAQAIKLSPGFADAYNNLGLACACLNSLDEALRHYDEAIRLDANFVDAYINRGIAYDALGRSQEALQDFGRAIEVNPYSSLAYLNRAITYYRVKDYAKALADLDRYKDLGEVPPESLLGDITRAAARSSQRGTRR